MLAVDGGFSHGQEIYLDYPIIFNNYFVAAMAGAPQFAPRGNQHSTKFGWVMNFKAESPNSTILFKNNYAVGCSIIWLGL